MGHDRHTMAVFAPALYLTVTVELSSSGNDEVHIHPAGQGFWIARMLKHLGERPLLCGPLGGESGRVIRGLLGQFRMDASIVDVAYRSPVIVSDRRSGDRELIAQSPPVTLERHEIDDMYGRLLEKAMGSELCVITGQSDEIFPIDFYQRLGHDLEAGGVRVVADLHGPELKAFLEGGPVEILKVSDEDLAEDGLLDVEDKTTHVRALESLAEAGARSLVLSRQDKPALIRLRDGWFEARTPELHPADHRGAGDSMTAGLATGLRRGMTEEETIRLACAAGAANVTRHGLGSADEGLIPGLAEKVEITPISPAPV